MGEKRKKGEQMLHKIIRSTINKVIQEKKSTIEETSEERLGRLLKEKDKIDKDKEDRDKEDKK